MIATCDRLRAAGLSGDLRKTLENARPLNTYGATRLTRIEPIVIRGMTTVKIADTTITVSQRDLDCLVVAMVTHGYWLVTKRKDLNDWYRIRWGPYYGDSDEFNCIDRVVTDTPVPNYTVLLDEAFEYGRDKYIRSVLAAVPGLQPVRSIVEGHFAPVDVDSDFRAASWDKWSNEGMMLLTIFRLRRGQWCWSRQKPTVCSYDTRKCYYGDTLVSCRCARLIFTWYDARFDGTCRAFNQLT